MNDNSLLPFALGTNSDSVVVSGNLNLTGQLSVTNAGGFGSGTYTLFTCTGALPVPPSFGSVNLTGNTLTLTGSNGTPGANYFVLQSSNLTSWARIATNQFDVNGGFSFTTNAPASTPQNFFRLQQP